MEHSEQINELAAALAKAQGEITGAKKDTENTFFKSKYADLAACWDACREPLAKNGLCIFQTPSTDETGAVIVTTMLAHQSGQWMRDSMACRPAKGDAQALGSVTTYLRRYGLAAIVGLAQVDDDGEGAVGRGEGGTAMEPTKSPMQRKKAGEWGQAAIARGVEPLQITALKNKLTDLSRALRDAVSQDDIKRLTQEEYAEVLLQASEDLPDWYAKVDEAIQEAYKDAVPGTVEADPAPNPYFVPVPRHKDGKAMWTDWRQRLEEMIDQAVSLDDVNAIAETNKPAYANYLKSDPDGAKALKQIIDNRRGFFAAAPATED